MWEFCIWSSFCAVNLNVLSSLKIILLMMAISSRKGEWAALLLVVSVSSSPWVGL